jgi:hypothetical protein
LWKGTGIVLQFFRELEIAVPIFRFGCDEEIQGDKESSDNENRDK